MAGTLLIKNALAIKPQGRTPSSILVEGGRIAAILGPRDSPRADEVVDAGGRPVIPGGIDPHVHLEVGAQTFEQDAATESRAAVTGGITTYIHFLIEQDSHFQWYDRYRRGVEENSLIDVAFHGCIMNETHLAELPRYVEDLQISSLKFFMAYRGATAFGKLSGVDDGQLLDGLRAAARYPHVVNMIHCENIDIVNRQVAKLQRASQSDLATWTSSRPAVCELEAIQRAAIFGQESGALVYVVHMSVGGGAAILKDWKARYPRLVGETCNTYLAFDQTRTIHPDPSTNAALLKVNPPLRTAEDVDLIWRAVADGTITTVGSDHCAYTRTLKGSDLWSAAPGLTGTGMILPVLLTEGVAKGRISLEQLVAVNSSNPARIFGLYPRKGAIEIGSDADLVIVDLDRRVTVRAEMLNSVCDWTPYDGYVTRGWPVTTIVGGRVVQNEGKIVDGSVRGRVLKHERYSH